VIHKQQLPETEYRDLKRVFHVQIRLLLWMLCKPETIRFERTQIERKFGAKIGKWLCGRIWKRGNHQNKFGDCLAALLTLAQNDAGQAKIAARAIRNDIQFAKAWGCIDFEMKFPGLPEPWKQTIHAVCIPFYESWLCSTGYKKSVFAFTTECLDRKCLLRAYRTNSNGVCSYCDGPLGDVGKIKEANDCEHFFPKSKFPHLCLHPCNLFVSCKGCNETWKVDHAPMGVADRAGLYGTYHPQLRPGRDHFNLVVVDDGPRHYRITLGDRAVPQRTATLNKALDIESRWANDINKRLRTNLSELIAEKRYSCRKRGPVDEDELREIIDDVIGFRESRIGQSIRMIRDIAVLKYQRAHQLASLLLECA
jgi:hypothetical protein